MLVFVSWVHRNAHGSCGAPQAAELDGERDAAVMEGCLLEEELVVARAEAARLAQQLADRSDGDSAVRGLWSDRQLLGVAMLQHESGCSAHQLGHGHVKKCADAHAEHSMSSRTLLHMLQLPMHAYCCRQEEARRAEDIACVRDELQRAVQDANDVQEMWQQAEARHATDAVRSARHLRAATT